MSGPPDISGMTSLKVDCTEPDNMPEKWNKDDLTSLFEKYGEIGDIFIPRDRATGRDRPFGFVRYFKEDDAEEAIKELDGYELEGVPIAVAKAKKSRDEAFQAARAAEQDRVKGRGRSDSRKTRRRSPSRRKQRYDDSRSRTPPRRRRRDDSRKRSRRDDSRRRRRR
mmetsp:Transcript_123799/g.214628  ORF Transcript_123799/g.214628 Transcript_123799/m.214628 type:complete len:167 (-) Transcript_123799:12-512(-)